MSSIKRNAFWLTGGGALAVMIGLCAIFSDSDGSVASANDKPDCDQSRTLVVDSSTSPFVPGAIKIKSDLSGCDFSGPV